MDGFDLAEDFRHVLKEFHGLVDGHVQDIGYRLALVSYLKRFAVIAFAVAHFAWNHHVGQEIHFDTLIPVTIACFTPASLHIE